MKSKYILQFIMFCMALLLPSAASAEEVKEEEAVEFAQTQGKNLLHAFSEPDIKVKYSTLDELLVNYVDLEYISRFVVGKYWRQMSDEQQKQYQDLFSRYAVSLYKGFPLAFDDKLSFSIVGSRKEGNEVLVTANIRYAPAKKCCNTEPVTEKEGIDILVEFRLHKKNGKITIIDIKVAESSLILSYRNRFYQMIKDADEEMEWFLEDFMLITVSAEKQYKLPDSF
jgi:phospholipid transport system substrate-binding protein